MKTTVDIPVTDTAGRLAFVVGRLTRELRAVKGGLSHGLLSALSSVTKSGPLRLADLAQIELVSAPSITRIVADLEAQGLVTRTPDPDDGRASLIAVTTAGQEAIRLARLARRQSIDDLLSILDDAELATIQAAMPALERLIAPR
jgi:DNA-binding MarR family transcriptional regulator